MQNVTADELRVLLIQKRTEGIVEGKRAEIQIEVCQQNLKGFDFSDIDISGSKFISCDMNGASFNNTIAKNVEFWSCQMRRCAFQYSTLNWSSFNSSNLELADFFQAQAIGCDFTKASATHCLFTSANLVNAIFDGAHLAGSDFSWAIGVGTVVSVHGIGGRRSTTLYFIERDNVRCGCWNNYNGGTLEEFEKRVKDEYGSKGEMPNRKYYNEYMDAIRFFKKCKKREG